jgi:hypothetical protein
MYKKTTIYQKEWHVATKLFKTQKENGFANVRRRLFSLKRRPLAQSKLTEKAWATLASK